MRSIVENNLKHWPDLAKKANEALDIIFNNRWSKKEREALYEEDCVVQSAITFASHHGGIDSTYWFSTKHGTVEVYVGDAPEDSYVKILDKQIKLVDL